MGENYRIEPGIVLPDSFPALRGRRALVTGGSRGIGRATAELFVAAGCSTLTLARHNCNIACDIGNARQVLGAMREARSAGALDFVVNCAGYIEPATVTGSTLSGWQRHLAVNLTGPFLVCREMIPHMAPDGVIVNVASSAARKGKAGWSAYAASKAALVNFTESVAAEGTRAYCVSPGRTDTLMRNQLYPDEDKDTLLDPVIVARLILFCCSAQNTFAPGQTFQIAR